MSRPEHQAPPDIVYDEKEARKYSTNSRIIDIQSKMSERALQLLNLPDGKSCFLLDIGCGSGLSGQILTEAGHYWVGIDIAPAMLEIAREREIEGDVFLWDMGHGVSFRAGTFDGAVSVSALQWLCNADRTEHVPRRRLRRFFQSLYNSLQKGARAVFQFYPESPAQIEMITTAAMKCGFSGGLVVDYPNSTRAKKYYLCLFAGPSSGYQQAKPIGEDVVDNEEEAVFYQANRIAARERKKRKPVKDRDWIQKKKESQRRRGLEVARDSKFTGRRRRPQF